MPKPTQKKDGHQAVCVFLKMPTLQAGIKKARDPRNVRNPAAQPPRWHAMRGVMVRVLMMRNHAENSLIRIKTNTNYGLHIKTDQKDKTWT